MPHKRNILFVPSRRLWMAWNDRLTRREILARAVWAVPVVLTVGLSKKALAQYLPPDNGGGGLPT